MLKNDFKRNRTGNIALLLFMTFAAGLIVAATIVVTGLFTSITGMYQTAKPPHFLQMHKGEINQETIDKFVSSYKGVTAWQTVPMIDVYGDDIKIIGDGSFRLSDSRLDISLVKQNKEYDLLLDKDRNIVQVKPGEIGIPVILLDSFKIKLGDKVVLTNNGVTKEFIVTMYVNDAQMNSTLCSSTRMLISDTDFNELFDKIGEKEYLIEVYFTDSSMASDFQTAYENTDLPQNGQAVTYTIIILLSALADIVMSLVLILVSMLLDMIALMCIKYTVMAALEEEIGEIGTMKAIGMSYIDIRNLYLTKYKMMVGTGIVIGFILARILSREFTKHVSKTFGNQPASFLSVVLPIASCLLVYLITIHYCKKILKKLKRVTVVDALVTGKGFSKKERVRDGLSRSMRLSVNLLLSVRETVLNFNGFMIVFLVMFIVSGIMIVPMNLLNTMKSKEFISYMGSSMDDILIEIDSGENLAKGHEALNNLLLQDTDINEFNEFKRVRVQTINSENELMNIHIDTGIHAGVELKYLLGKAPVQKNEIALSKLNADEIGKSIGDYILLRFRDKQAKFLISGIYQDVTSGGYTAKSINNFEGLEIEKYQYTINLMDNVNAKEKAVIWSEKLGGGFDILPMEEFINQTLGGVSRQIEVATTAVFVIGMILIALIVVLFMKLRLVKDVSQIAAMKAIGFTDNDIRKQYLYKIGMVSFIGICAGTFISNILGETIVSMAFGMMDLGITKVTFIINPFIAYLMVPLVLFIVTLVITWHSSRQIRDYNIFFLINE
jgi:putative ABC transport system permease protein